MKHNATDRQAMQKVFRMQCEICKALGHPTRLALVDRLKDGEASAAELIADMDISKANLSKHVALLVRGGIAESRREGRKIFYRLLDPEIHKACAIMRAILYRRLKEGEKLASVLSPARVRH